MMPVVVEAIDMVVAGAPQVVLGVTVILTVGVLLSVGRRALGHKVAETTVAAALLFVALALVPVPRPLALRAAAPVTAPVALEAAAARSADAAPGLLLPSPAHVGGDPVPVIDASRPAVRTTVRFVARATVIGYGAGAGLLLLWMALGWWRLRRTLAAAATATPAQVAAVGEPLPPRLRLAFAAVSRPFCCGLRRPTVVLPATLANPERAALLRVAVQHELAHLRRGDHRAAWLLAGAMPLLFGHPLFWFLRRRARRDSEVVADAVAARACGGGLIYARRLLELAAAGRDTPAGVCTAALTVSMFHRPSELTERIEMLIRRAEPSSPPRLLPRALRYLALSATLLASVGLWGTSPLAAQEQGADDTGQVGRSDHRGAAAKGDDERLALKREIGRLRQEIEALQKLAQGGQLARALGDVELSRRLSATDFAKVRQSAAPADAAPATDPVGDGPFQFVDVRAGDTLAKLAHRHLGRADADAIARLQQCNPGLDPRHLAVGQRLAVPVAPAPSPSQPVALAAAAPDALLALLTRRIEQQAAVRRAELHFNHVVDAAVPVFGSREQAEIDVQMARDKLDLTMQMIRLRVEMVKADLDDAQLRLKQVALLASKGFVSKAERTRVEAEVRNLKGLLGFLARGK